MVGESAARGHHGLFRAIKWLRVLARSSVDIPQETLAQIAKLVRELDVPFNFQVSFAEIQFCSAWTGPSDRHDMIGVLSRLCSRNLVSATTGREDQASRAMS